MDKVLRKPTRIKKKAIITYLDDKPHEQRQEDYQYSQRVRAIIPSVCVRPDDRKHAHRHHGEDASHGRLTGAIGQDEY